MEKTPVSLPPSDVTPGEAAADPPSRPALASRRGDGDAALALADLVAETFFVCKDTGAGLY